MAPIDLDAFLDFIRERTDETVIDALNAMPRGDLARLSAAVRNALEA